MFLNKAFCFASFMTLSYNLPMSSASSKSQNQPQHWLIKSEPSAYSIEQLKKDKKTLWEGVRNYQARNFMSQSMRVGDSVLFYHSNAEAPWITGIVGLAEVSGAAVPDPSQFNRKSDYFDPKATLAKPTWFCVEIKFKEVFKKPLPLSKIKELAELKNMAVIKPGQRLSIQPVSPEDFNSICKLCS